MATYTRRELVTQALANLSVLQAGETPAAEDYADVDRYVPGLLDRLSDPAIRLLTVIDPENIEARYFHPLAVLLADAAKAEYGSPVFDVAKAEADLRRMARSGPTYEVMRADYF